jgi:quinoprotein glucose dehydrogenase
LLLCLLPVLRVASAQQHKTWKDYGSGPDSSKFMDLDQIDKSNVGDLQVAWTYPTGDKSTYLFNPVIVDDVMYVLARGNSLVALDAATGKEIWIHENLRGIASRGINYWESKDRKDRRLIFQINNRLQAIDARTGKSILTFGKNGLVDLREGLGRDPKTIFRVQSGTPGKIFENLILLGSATGEGYFATPGFLRAYDVVSGKLVWTFRTIPQPGEFGYETWPKDAWKYIGGANTWGEISVDEKRGIAYFPTGSPTYDYYGADRIGSNLFGNCLLAIDARSGKRLWHFQMVHHDLWDYDAVSAPQLITVRHGDKTIDAVAQASKQGFLYVFDRVTGEPLWPIEERPVPKSDVPGEEAWPTQPFPVAPPPFARQSMTADDLTPYLLTPEERATWKDRIASARKGLFLPPSEHETLAIPGARGGSNWGTTAANPKDGIVYLLTQDWPSFYKMGLETPGGGGRRLARQGEALYTQTCQGCHGADRAGSASVPSLLGMGDRLSLAEFKQITLAGKGKMPAFPSIEDDVMRGLFVYLGGNPFRPPPQVVMEGADRGPVVASGGAPGGLELPSGRSQFFGMAGPPYPEGIEVPPNRYYTSYGLEFPYITAPPWSSIAAYDLNKGTIKWKVPLGEDKAAVAEGGKNTGVPRGGERQGIIPTATGLVFATAKDGKLRAFDADNGEVLWTAELPAGTEGIPAMYEVNGRQFLVVCATNPLTWGRETRAGSGALGDDGASDLQRAYIAFALPVKAEPKE